VTTRSHPHPRRRPTRGRLVGAACVLPLAAAVVGLAVWPAPGPTSLQRSTQSVVSQAPAALCDGPMTTPKGTDTDAGDEDLASAGPSESVGVRTLALDPSSSLLFGEVSASTTRIDADGDPLAPTITTTGADGTEKDVPVATGDVGTAVGSVTSTKDRVSTRATGEDTQEGTGPSDGGGASDAGGASDGGGADDEAAPEAPPAAVSDTVQVSTTTSGDYRSLAVSRCEAPTVHGTFLGMSTARGASADLVLTNTSSRPATASVQIRTPDGPASMGGRSRVVVPAGKTEHVLLESIASGQDVTGLEVSTVGAPLGMHVQATERDGLAPGGGEQLAPLPDAATESMIPGIYAGKGTTPTAVLMNSTGSDAHVELTAQGTGGAVDLGDDATVEVPAGTVRSVPLKGIVGGAGLRVHSDAPVGAVVRSAARSDKKLGATIGAPRDLQVAVPTSALGDAAVQALPTTAEGHLSLMAEDDAKVTIIPVGRDGEAGTPLTKDLTAKALTTVGAGDLAGTKSPVAGFVLVPDDPDSVHAAWVQSARGKDKGLMVSTVPVQDPQGEASRETTVTLH
jgi:hypothetical protein